MPGITIELKEVNIFYDDYQVLTDLSLVFQQGKTNVIVGPSGCGKSTLLKIAASLIPPDHGKVLYDGKDAFRMSEKQMEQFRKTNGFVFQNSALWSNKSIFQNLSLPLEFHFRHLSKNEISSRIEEQVHKVGLDENLNLRPSQLSQGETKLVSIARALITDPDTIFMDSPLSGLDHDSYKKFMDILKALKADNKTIIITNNDPELTSKFADFLFVLKNGILIESGDFNSVVNTGNKEVQAVIGGILNQVPSYDGNILDLLEPGS